MRKNTNIKNSYLIVFLLLGCFQLTFAQETLEKELLVGTWQCDLETLEKELNQAYEVVLVQAQTQKEREKLESEKERLITQNLEGFKNLKITVNADTWLGEFQGESQTGTWDLEGDILYWIQKKPSK